MRICLALVVALSSACTYSVKFVDCQVGCNGPDDCPSGFACGTEGLCRIAQASGTCAALLDANDAGDDGGGGGGFVGNDLTYVKASNTNAGDLFGSAVALSADGSTLAIGAVGEDSNARTIGGNELDNSAPASGAVYIFVRAGASWVQQAYIKAANADSSDEFGSSVALSADGNTLAVGAHGEASSATGINGDSANNARLGAGAAYVFVRAGTSWSQQAYVKASNTGQNDDFGEVVALSGDGNTLAVSAPLEDSANPNDPANNSAPDSGAVFVFARSGTTWAQLAYLKADVPQMDDRFGIGLAVSGDGSTVGVGVPLARAATIAQAGAVYVFTRSGQALVRQAVLTASTPGQGDNLGQSVALSATGDTLVTGTPNEDSKAKNVGGDETDNSAMRSGAAYVFVRSGTDWSQEAYVKASNTDPGDELGDRVAISASGDTIAIGAIFESSAATRIGGDQTDNSASSAGAAYVLQRSGTTWAHHAYVKASNPDAADELFVVTLSGDASVGAFGAPGESSVATGVDGDQTDNTAPNAGAVYVYF